MNRLKIDTSGSRIMAADTEARPAQVYEGDGDNRRAVGQATDEHGVPLWTVSLVLADDGGAETIRVKFPRRSAEPPQFQVLGMVAVKGLRATIVRGNTYFAAEAIAPAQAAKGTA